jgi:hypothetical protein
MIYLTVGGVCMRSFSKVVLAFGIANKGKGGILKRGMEQFNFFQAKKKFFGFFGFAGLSFVGLSFVGFVVYTFSLFRQSWLQQGRPWPP